MLREGGLLGRSPCKERPPTRREVHLPDSIRLRTTVLLPRHFKPVNGALRCWNSSTVALKWLQRLELFR